MGVVPGFVGVAVNIIEVPAQTLFTEATIVTFAESPGFTVTAKSTGVPEQLPILGVIW